MTRTVLALAICTALAGVASADCPQRAPGTPVKAHVVRERGVTKVVIETTIDVCGRPPAPQVAYLAPALHLDYQWADVELDFLPLIVRAVESRAFDGTRSRPVQP